MDDTLIVCALLAISFAAIGWIYHPMSQLASGVSIGFVTIIVGLIIKEMNNG